jgi:hypothetical protein
MSISHTVEIIKETKNILIFDYKSEYKKEPTSKNLLLHVKSLIKDERIDEILEEVLVDEDVMNLEVDYKTLLLTAACLCD